MQMLKSLKRAMYAREISLRNSKQSDRRCRILLDPDSILTNNLMIGTILLVKASV